MSQPGVESTNPLEKSSIHFAGPFCVSLRTQSHHVCKFSVTRWVYERWGAVPERDLLCSREKCCQTTRQAITVVKNEGCSAALCLVQGVRTNRSNRRFLFYSSWLLSLGDDCCHPSDAPQSKAPVVVSFKDDSSACSRRAELAIHVTTWWTRE